MRVGWALAALLASGGMAQAATVVTAAPLSGPAGGVRLSCEEIEAIADEAHMLGRRAAVHAHGTDGAHDALRAGVDTIEHASPADEESSRLARVHGARFDMDASSDDDILAWVLKGGQVVTQPKS